MNAPTNMALYRYLVAHGATAEEALDAATMEASTLATKADLTTALAELKADLFRHTTIVLLTSMGIYAGIVGLMFALFAFGVRFLPVGGGA